MAREERRFRPGRLAVILTLFGPGIISAFAGNDPGGISTYSQAGAVFGYQMLWLIFLMTFSLVVVQEMVVRMGVVTGKGLSALIRERFGIRATTFAMVALLISNLATTVAEFAGVAAAFEIFGVSRYVSVPLTAAIVWLLVVRGDYRQVERVFLALSAVFITYVFAAFLAHPDWRAVIHATLVPSITPTRSFALLAIALVGTTITPYMQFFLQSNAVDKGLGRGDLRRVRVDVIFGAIAADIVAFFIIVTAGAVLHPRGIVIEDAAQAALALAPVAGMYATGLFAIGLLGSALLAASVLPLTTAYAVCEAFGWEAAIDRPWREAPAFNSIYTGAIVFGAGAILLPGINLVTVMIVTQAVSGVLLPVLLAFIIVLANDRRVMGHDTNGPIFNILAWGTVAAVTGLTAILLVMTALGVH